MTATVCALASAALLALAQPAKVPGDAADVLALEQKIEAAVVRGDVAITYGRYVSLFVPKNRGSAPGQLNSIWFERVYAKRDGQWKFLSHRTVHGPTVSPAGVDPAAAR